MGSAAAPVKCSEGPGPPAGPPPVPAAQRCVRAGWPRSTYVPRGAVPGRRWCYHLVRLFVRTHSPRRAAGGARGRDPALAAGGSSQVPDAVVQPLGSETAAVVPYRALVQAADARNLNAAVVDTSELVGRGDRRRGQGDRRLHPPAQGRAGTSPRRPPRARRPPARRRGPARRIRPGRAAAGRWRGGARGRRRSSPAPAPG